MAKLDIHDYLDYRTFLRDALALEKASGRIAGQRDVATFLGLKSSGHVSWILQGKRALVPRLVPGVAELFRLGAEETSYLALLVEHNDTEDPQERRLLMARIARAQSSRKRLLPAAKASYWSSWHHAVLRELVAVDRFRREDAIRLGRRLEPPASAEEVRASLDLLEELELVGREADGTYRRTDSILSAGENWSQESVRDFQDAILQLARRALREIPREEREISTVTFSVSPQAFQRIRGKIREMRQEILALVRTDPSPTRVYHLAIQTFPASRPAEEAHV
jgi:uncharacterized protein (TIGR02147 family)